MTLIELIDFLSKLPYDMKMSFGLANPHSYRGFYNELAFEPADPMTVGEILDVLRSAIGETYSGYKGGQYTMTYETPIWMAHWGVTGQRILGLGLQFERGDWS